MITSDVNKIINSAFSGLEVNDIQNIEAVNTMLDNFGLRWKTLKEPVILVDGVQTDFYSIVRADTRTMFTAFKKGYRPYQNSELAELIIRICDKAGYEVHSGGALNHGAKVYLQVATNNRIKGLGQNGTTVEGYVTAINSHDGSSKLKWGVSNLTICCENTFKLAAGQLEHSARHTEKMQEKVDEALRKIERLHAVEKTLFDQYMRLAEIPVSCDHIAKIVHLVTKVDLATIPTTAKTQYSTRAIDSTDKLAKSIAHEMAEKGNTLWGLFSGVTHYTTHKMTTPKRENGLIESKFVGRGHEIDNLVFNSILEMANC